MGVCVCLCVRALARVPKSVYVIATGAGRARGEHLGAVRGQQKKCLERIDYRKTTFKYIHKHPYDRPVSACVCVVHTTIPTYVCVELHPVSFACLSQV